LDWQSLRLKLYVFQAGSAATNQVLTEPTKNPEQERLQVALQETVAHMELKGRTPKEIKELKRELARILKETKDVFDSKATTKAILKMKRKKAPEIPLTKGYIKRHITAYQVFCEANQIPFDKPKINYTPPIPLIPSTEQVKEIIHHTSAKYTCVFTIMAETAVEGEELHRTHITQINKETGTISIIGTKGHDNGVYKLKSQTADMLRQYLARNPNKEYPFPRPKTMSETWRNARKRAIKKLCKPELKQIPLKNLRNYAGAIFYKTTGHHDPIQTMRFMRHKKLETTLHYIRGINLDEPEEYITVMVKLGEPDTIKRIQELSNAGYNFLSEADGYQAYRIHK
jgi:integrase